MVKLTAKEAEVKDRVNLSRICNVITFVISINKFRVRFEQSTAEGLNNLERHSIVSNT